MTSDPEPPVRILGRYAICGTIGVGGMATVHVGRLLGPVGFSRTVAIKRMHQQFAKDPEFVTMFLDEARIAARVQHANVVSTLDVVTEEGELFHVMEYVEGEPLSKILTALERSNGARLPLPVLGSIVSQMLHGLHAVHEARGEDGRPLGLIHRDVSPDNVLVGRDGSARVLDFGIAKATELGRRTQAGKIKGKVAYMSPEHLRGKDLDRRADLFSAGAVLWEGVTGKRLIPGATDIEMVHNAISFRPRPPSSVVPLPPVIDALLMRALSLDPAGRFSTAREMAIAIEQALGVASPTMVGEVVETTMGGELAKKAAIVDSAVKLAARIGSDPSRGRPISDPTTSSPVASARPPAGPFQPAPAAARLDPPPSSIETFSRRGTELMPGPPPAAIASTRQGFARLGSSATEIMPNRPAASAPSLELPPLGESPPEARAQATMLDPFPAAGRTMAIAPSPSPAPPRVESRITTPSGGFYLVHGSPREDPPSPSRRGERDLNVDFGSAARAPQPSEAALRSPPSHGYAPGPRPPSAGGAGFIRHGGVVPAAPSRSSASIVVPVALAVGVLGLLAFLFFRRGAADDKLMSSAAPPPTQEEVTACDTLRRHVRSGGQATGMSKAGWALELWLRAPKGERIDAGAIDVADLVGDAKGTTVEVVSLNAPGKTADEGTVVRLRGAGAERAFDKDAVAGLVAASDRIFEKTKAEAGGLYLRCAHLAFHDVGLWFRGKDSSTASTALLFAMGLFGDPDVVRDEALETADVVERPSMFERIAIKLGPSGGKPLEEELTKYNATVDRPAGGGVRITFATTNLGSAVRASRIVADHAGVEQL